jgi:hypothetical protein
MSNDTLGMGSAVLLTLILLLLRHGLTLLGRRRQRPRGTYHAMAAAAVVLACAALMEARAQQTLFNVPSSDVLPKAKVYGELDVTWKPNDNANHTVPRFSSFVPRLVVGLGGGVEVGLNVNGNVQPGPDATTLVPAIKWRIYNGKDNGWSLVIGDHMFIPVRQQAYDAGDYAYAQISKSFNGGRTRVTAGGYDFTPGVVAPSAHRAGGQFGFEHAVNTKLTVQADWFTGKHANGYFTPGFYFKPRPKVTLYGGYSIGNAGAGRGNHFFYTALGVSFN